MKQYLKLFKEKLFIGILIVLCCACLGSLRGALKEEENYWVGVTQEDIVVTNQAGQTMPLLVGFLPLAPEQIHWKNFSYARIYALRGFGIYAIIVFCYMLISKR